MKKNLLQILTLLSCIIPTFATSNANAEVLTINDGATLTVDGPTLDLNCLDILVKDGGTLILKSGMIQDLGAKTVETGGLFTKISGTIDYPTCPPSNSLPEVTPGQSFTIPEDRANDTSVGTVAATDDDTGTSFNNWIIARGNEDGIFSIGLTSGEIKVDDNTNLDFDTTSSYSLFITVSDGTDDSAAGEVIVNITGVNEPPELNAIGSQAVDELTQLTFTATATDPDVPADDITFSLTGEPSGASITPSGDFTWTPTEALGPGTYEFDVFVQDNGNHNLSDSETISVTVNEVNVAPVLDPVGTQTAEDLTLLTFTANANDVDLPANKLTFSLFGEPAGALINPDTGVFTWIPPSNDSGSYNVDLWVNDGTVGVKQSFIINVTDVNHSPVFTGTPTITGTPKEGFTLGLTDTGTYDGDGDSVTLSYQWKVDGVDINSATSDSFLVTKTEKDKTVTCTLVADDGVGDTTTFTTAGVLIYKFNWWIFHEAITSKKFRPK